MRVRSISKRLRSGQAIIMFTMMVASVLIPMVGLAIDGGRSYLVRLKLSSAVDGGSLAAARLLGTGATSALQLLNAQATAALFVKANFPVKFFGADLMAGSPTVCVDDGKDSTDPCQVGIKGGKVITYKVRTVVVRASAQMPTFFMRIFGMPLATVNSSGVASRRDVRVVLVMDRSSSMSGYYTGLNQDPASINDLALKFVNSFSGSADLGGRDELGMVVFGGSAIVAYPPRNITKDYTDYTQFTPPDNKFKLAGNIPKYIADLKQGSNTGTAEALYLAYSTLRADANTNPDLATKLNVIVLFTDGLPNGITTFANDPNQTKNYMMTAASGCKNLGKGTMSTPLVSSANNNMIGWFAQWGGFDVDNNDGANGLFPPMMGYAYPGKNGTGDDIDAYMLNANQDNPKVNVNIGTHTKTKNGKDKNGNVIYIDTVDYSHAVWKNGVAQAVGQDAGCIGGLGNDSLGNPITAGQDAAGNPIGTNGTPMITAGGVRTMDKFPDHDLYGNSTNLTLGAPAVPTGPTANLYEQGSLWQTAAQCNKKVYDPNATTNACQIGLASWQATAHQAWKIWNQMVWNKATQTNVPDPGPYQPQPIIFTIGFTSNPADPPDMTLLKIIANDPTSPAPFSNRIKGMAFQASDPGAVDAAFQQISREILRLSQ